MTCGLKIRVCTSTCINTNNHVHTYIHTYIHTYMYIWMDGKFLILITHLVIV
jgi:hypothetical protein